MGSIYPLQCTIFHEDGINKTRNLLNNWQAENAIDSTYCNRSRRSNAAERETGWTIALLI